MSEKIKHARALAEHHHADQRYGDKPYMYHIEGVEGMARTLAVSLAHTFDWVPDIESVSVVALLHDIIEDCDVTIADLTAMDIFTAEEIRAIDLVTKHDDYDYDKYIAEINKCPLAKIVKYADTSFNLQRSIASKSKKRIKKYTKQKEMLSFEE